LKFATQEGVPHYQYVLHPRTTGFVHLLQKMQSAGYFSTLYDISVGYGGHIVQGEMDLIVRGMCPEKAYFHVEKVDLGELAGKSEEELAEWLKKRWVRKEETMRDFYRTGSFGASGERFQVTALSLPFQLS